MLKADPNNLVNTETTKLMNQLEVDPTYAVGFNGQGRFATQGMPLTPSESIFDYQISWWRHKLNKWLKNITKRI